MSNLSSQLLKMARNAIAELRTVGARLLVIQRQIETITEGQHAQGQLPQAPPMVRAMLEVPESEKKQEEAHKTEKKWLERFRTLIELLTLAAVVAYAIINSRMLHQMRIATQKAGISADAAKSSADFLKQEIVSRQAAVIRVYFQVNFQPSVISSAPHGLFAAFDCTPALAMASDVHASLDVSSKTKRKPQTIGEPQHFDLATPGFRSTWFGELPLPGLTSNLWDEISAGKGDRTIEIRGGFTYNNGFAQVPEQTFCFIWYAHPQVLNIGPESNFVNCSDYSSEVAFWDSLDRRAAKTSKH